MIKLPRKTKHMQNSLALVPLLVCCAPVICTTFPSLLLALHILTCCVELLLEPLLIPLNQIMKCIANVSHSQQRRSAWAVSIMPTLGKFTGPIDGEVGCL
jgi:hypothetical protein